MNKIYNIEGQKVYDCSKHLHFHIKQPVWQGAKVYGWDKSLGNVGIGISKDILDKATKLKRKLKITYYKNRKDKYIITPSLFKKFAKGQYQARGKTEILVAPVSKFTHIKKETGKYVNNVWVVDQEDSV